MNDFQGLLSGDYGFKPQGKSAPMAPLRSNPTTANPLFDFDLAGSSTTKNPPYSESNVSLDDHDNFFSRPTGGRKDNDFDSIFSGPGDSGSRFPSLPVFDKPVYDDEHDSFDDLLGGLARNEPQPKGLGGSGRRNDKDIPAAFDDLLPGFGGNSPLPSNRNPLDSSWDNQPTGRAAVKARIVEEDPFVVLKSSSYSGPSTQALNDDPLEHISTFASSSSKNFENVSSSRGLFDDTDPLASSRKNRSENISAGGGLFDDIDPLGGLGNSVPINNMEKIGSPDRPERTASSGQTSANVEGRDRSSSLGSPQRNFKEKKTPDEYYETPSFDTYSAPVDFQSSAPNTFSSSYVNAGDNTSSQTHTSTVFDSNLDSSDDVWLTVSEVPLFTQPTPAPPPARPPPPKPARISKAGPGSNVPPYAKKKSDDHSAFPAGGKSSFASQVDELEDFAKGRSWNDPVGNSDVLSSDGLERNSDAAASAAAMKEAMDKAEARFKHAKEARERENAKATRMQQEREDRKIAESQEREFRERKERERLVREDEERKQREEEERMRREIEAKEKEQRKIERERSEKERVRQAVERATREARDRAAADARSRAEKAAVKAQTEARERSERNVVFKAQAEARERAARAAFEAKQRTDREKAEREVREKAEREAKEKEARDKAAAARASQQKNENDLESFFGMGRASSAPRPRASSSGDPFFDSQLPKKQSESVRTSVGSAANIRKTSSSANIVDDLSSIFGGTPSAGQFQEFEGETEDRRRARLQRHQRTQERAAKALAEKNQRDLDVQNEQVERDRIGETLDVEIKRWAAGKEGNLRALLSTLQYVLWPGCGWQPVSLTDLIIAAAVKKVYRKATLCIHPDKVQQKGATLQQKYVAEKVFDLLKEAWNKFNSEELF